MLTISESGSQAWALATTNGDLRIYSRDGDHEWSEMFLSDDAEQLDESGSLILEALYERQSASDQDEADEGPELDSKTTSLRPRETTSLRPRKMSKRKRKTRMK